MIALAPILAYRLDFEGFLWIGGMIFVVVMLASRRRGGQRCSKCREVNRGGATFCAQCGRRLPGR